MTGQRRVLRGSAIAAALLFSYGLGALSSANDRPWANEPEAADGVLDEASDRIAAEAARPISRDELHKAAITAMLRRLGDPWARYYPAQEFDDFTGWLNKDRKAVRPEPQDDDVTVRQRDKATMIKISVFTKGVSNQVRAAVAGSRGVVLDLRGNPGGLLDEAVETASSFLTSGPVVTFERRGARPELLSVTRPGNGRVPLVVLVDSGTASAAEIVAGSLRDRDRAVIVGSPTFGKATVQEPVRLSDGSAVELTVGRYRTPSGRSLEGVGIEPDVVVRKDDAERRALDVLTGLTGA